MVITLKCLAYGLVAKNEWKVTQHDSREDIATCKCITKEKMQHLTTHTSLSPIRRGFAPGFVNHKKGCTRLAAASNKVYQLLANGRGFSPGTLSSSTTKTGRHDIAEILLKVVLSTINQIKKQICKKKKPTCNFS